MRRISQLDTMKIERKDERDNGRKSFFFFLIKALSKTTYPTKEKREEKKNTWNRR